eukprot:jgi/Undpi1/2481/HiC_scaffold_13.g05860.m1
MYSKPRSSEQRGSRSGGGASTFNVYSHLGQGAVTDPYSKDGPTIVAPRSFYRAIDPITHSHSAGSQSGDSRDTRDSRRSFASAGAQAVASGSPQVSSRRSGSWGGGASSSVGEALAWGTSAAHNQVASSESYYRRSRGEGNLSREERGAGLTSSRLASSRTKIAGTGSPHPDTSDSYTNNRNNIINSGSSNTNNNGNPKYRDAVDPTLDPRSQYTPMSHGGLTSSSAYGSGYPESSSPTKYASSQMGNKKQVFSGFGGNFGERSAAKTGRSMGGRAKGGFPPGFAPASGGGVEAALSSNAFARGHSQNCGNVITGRPSSRVTAPPGGHSTFSLG